MFVHGVSLDDGAAAPNPVLQRHTPLLERNRYGELLCSAYA